MRKLLLLFVLWSAAAFCQDYKKDWGKVVKLEDLGLVKSADKAVEKISKKAERHQNDAQLVKCFFYRAKFLQTLDAKHKLITLEKLRNLTHSGSGDVRAIYCVIYAKCLKSYLTENYYRLNTTSVVNDSLPTDMALWSRKHFDGEIANAYESSMQNRKLLKTTKLSKYEAIFDYVFADKFKNQTLFDWIVSENITFRQSDSHFTYFREYRTSETLPYLAADSRKFASANFDTVARKHDKEILKLLQEREESQPTIANRLYRLQFFFGNSSSSYVRELLKIRKETTDAIEMNDIRLALAETYNSMASKTDLEYKTMALSLTDSIISTQIRSNAYLNAVKLKDQILAKSLEVSLMRFRFPGENNRARISVKNIDSLTVNCYKMDASIQYLSEYADRNEKLWRLYDRTPISSTKIGLKMPSPYFEYSTETLLPELPIGTYILEFTAPDRDSETMLRDAQIVVVTNLAYITTERRDTNEIAVFSRDKGKPIKDASISLRRSLKDSVVTQKGQFKIPRTHENSVVLTGWIAKDADSLSISQHYYPSYDRVPKAQASVTFLLDRAIYRPGQKVYFKGILMYRDSISQGAMPNARLSVTAYDVNRQSIFTKEVLSNEFGSFSGEFELPTNVLTGNFSISVSEVTDFVSNGKAFWDDYDLSGSLSFKVEEYKRPRFEVELAKPKKRYVIGQTVLVDGKAKSLSGSDVSGAKVNYKVTLLSVDSYDRNYDSENENETIAEDSLVTDEKGNFEIRFAADALEDEDEEDRAELPVYRYKIEVSVTDLNGETRETSTEAKVGYHLLKLDFTDYWMTLTKSKNNKIAIRTTDLNDEHLDAKGKIEFSLVRWPKRNFRDRVFSLPELRAFSAAEFAKLFPNEVDESSLDVGADTLVVKTIAVDSKSGDNVWADLSDMKPAFYKMVFTCKDESGHDIKIEKEVEITDPEAKIDFGKLFTVKQLNDSPQKDGYAKLLVTSFVPDLTLRVEANDSRKAIYKDEIVLKNHEAIIKIPFSEKNRSGVNVLFDSYYDHTLQTYTHEIDRPFVPQRLELETTSFRNLIEPGSSQNWSFKLKPINSDLESEILASMYDSSLDALAKQDWHWSPMPYYNYNRYYSRKDTPRYYPQSLHAYSKKRGPYGFVRPEVPLLMQFGFDPVKNKASAAHRLYREQLMRKAKPANAELVYGKVTDIYGPVPNVVISVKNSDRSVLSDDDGYYEIEVAQDEVLGYYSPGLKEKEIVVVGYGQTNVELRQENNQLGEVVVTGAMGIRKKMDAQTATSQVVRYGVLSDEPTTVMALVGKVQGLQIVNADATGANASPRIVLRGNRSLPENNEVIVVVDGQIVSMADFQAMNPNDIVSLNVLKGAQGAALYGSQGANGVIVVTSKKAFADLGQVKTRTNLSETAFFFPHLKTDGKGNIVFSFTSPESLTSWKLRLFAHNKKGVSGQLQQKVTTQKSLMLTPNFPRFFRESDTIVISVKISNMTAKLLNGNAMLELSDAATMQNIDAASANAKKVQPFRINPSGNASLEWKIVVPQGLSGLHYKVVAKSGDFSDGEENIIPVVANRMLVTESKPLWVREHSQQQVTFEHLKNNTSTTLKNHQMTLEFTSNPAWLALQSLPYLIEYQHECAEQTFSRYYGNALATSVINSNPKVAEVFAKWRENGKGNLEQNQELKSTLVNETPWFNDALSESEKKKRLALVFDLEKMKASQSSTLDKLRQKQKTSGAFAWFDGGEDDEFITRHIASGIGHLKKLGISDDGIFEVGKRAIPYLDDIYLRTKLKAKSDKNRFHRNYSDVHYLYARSFYLDEIPLKSAISEEIERDLNQIILDRLELDIYQKAMAALVLHRFGKTKQAKEIVDNLRETSASDETNGMFWVDNSAGWYWYRAPIETQALLIEAFLEVAGDTKSVSAMKAWLIKNKQTSHWPTTKSTTEAVYALLLQGGNWIDVKDNVVFKVGNEKILSRKLSENEKEAQTGYVKIDWKASEILPEMATLKVENKTDVPGFGGFYWQYFEDLDKVSKSDKGVLNVRTELLKKVSSPDGEKFQKVAPDSKLKVGDLLTIRITIQASEDLEYVHLKSMRASCFEPVDVLSGYQWKPNMSFYKSTKDVATHFFFSRLNSGSYELEYEVRVNNSGNFSNGITTIQSMYAPEFSGHSGGVRVQSSK